MLSSASPTLAASVAVPVSDLRRTERG